MSFNPEHQQKEKIMAQIALNKQKMEKYQGFLDKDHTDITAAGIIERIRVQNNELEDRLKIFSRDNSSGVIGQEAVLLEVIQDDAQKTVENFKKAAATVEEEARKVGDLGVEPSASQEDVLEKQTETEIQYVKERYGNGLTVFPTNPETPEQKEKFRSEALAYGRTLIAAMEADAGPNFGNNKTEFAKQYEICIKSLQEMGIDIPNLPDIEKYKKGNENLNLLSTNLSRWYKDLKAVVESKLGGE